jgi:hypothetical protein
MGIPRFSCRRYQVNGGESLFTSVSLLGYTRAVQDATLTLNPDARAAKSHPTHAR